MILRQCHSWTTLASNSAIRRRVRRPPVVRLQQLSSQCAPTTGTNNSVELKIPTCQDMQQVGAVLYSVLASYNDKVPLIPSVICLDGDLAAGKTAFCQGFIRAATGDWEMPITSPTYLLSNSYTAQMEVGDQQTAAIE
jgi:hypothetical protein